MRFRTFSWRSKLVIAWMAVAGSLAGRHQASAADPGDVESLIREGMELRRAGRDERALPFFQKAYSIEHNPRTAGQLGLAEMSVGYWLSAEGHLSEGLESPEHPWIAKNRQVLERALEQTSAKVGTVTITGGPVGAAVRVNGSQVGVFPLSAPVRVGEGRVLIEVAAPAYQTATQKVHLAGGGKERISIVLVRDAKPADPEASSTATAVKSEAPPSENGQEKQRAKDDGLPPDNASGGGSSPGASKGSSIVAYGAAGLAVGSLVFAVIETIRWKNKENDFSNHSGPPATSPSSVTIVNCGEEDPGRGAVGCSDIYDSGKRARLLALVGYGAAAALAAGSLFLFIIDRRGNPSEDPKIAFCGPDFSLRGASCGWRF